MICYFDSSVVLRKVLHAPGVLREWPEVKRGVASLLVEVECMRTFDRLFHQGDLSANQVMAKRTEIYRLMDSLVVIHPTPAILSRAGQPFPLPVKTLDAIHLASALAYRDENSVPIVLATHDRRLALAARASGLTVIGCD